MSSKRRRLNTATKAHRSLSEPSQTCPICSFPVPLSQLHSHYLDERAKLDLEQSTRQSTKRPAAVVALAKITDRPRISKRSEVSVVLSRVRTNYEARRKNEIPEVDSIEQCPICGLELVGIGVAASEHVSSCLDAMTERDEEGDGWNVYTFGGQTRVRAIDLLEGGVASLPGATIRAADDEGVDVLVDIEGDADAVYGRQQYTEADLTNPESSASKGKSSGFFPFVALLMQDLRCNICLNSYNTPVISVQCFHTYCEKCWLQALQSQKLCPQCRVITQPADLRRIYL
jgi:E3 ubiquitin-protein ligase RNF220/Zinc finger, C3HC4 type (RING finger)